MADVLIMGMEIPRRREEVFLFAVDSDGKVYGWNSEVLPRLKAIAVPPHGRLIDADLTLKRLNKTCQSVYGKESIPEQSALFVAANFVETSPTIIPASEGVQ